MKVVNADDCTNSTAAQWSAWVYGTNCKHASMAGDYEQEPMRFTKIMPMKWLKKTVTYLGRQ
jgi:hypothetical protein